MPHNVSKLLFDALKAIDELNTIRASFDGKFQNYKNNLTGKRAVEREFEIIGEAIGKALKIDPDLKITDARKITGLRNYIIHSYDNVQDEIIWGIMVNNLDNLRKEINSLLNQ